MNGCGGMNLSPALVLVAASHQDEAPSFFVLPRLDRCSFQTESELRLVIDGRPPLHSLLSYAFLTNGCKWR